jgi:hypothetical protein
MEITPAALAIVLVCASLVVIGMLIHYVMRVGRRYDQLCLYGLLAASLGLQQSARGLDTPLNQFSAMSFGFAMFCIALALWREGLRRFRNAG